MDYLNSIENIIGGISTIIVIFEIIFKLYMFFSRKRFIKMTLNFKGKSCLVSQAIYTDLQNPKDQYVHRTSVEASQKISEMLKEVHYVIMPFEDSYEGQNIIHVGGPAANIHVNALFAEKMKKLTFCTPQTDEPNHERLELNKSCIQYSNGDRYFKVGHKILNIDANTRDYGIFIRIPYNKRDGIEYTTHIIFGCWANGTLKAFEFFTKNYKMIAKKYRKSKYCFAIPINRIDNSIALISDRDIIDLTNEFFD